MQNDKKKEEIKTFNENCDETIEYEVYADSPKTIITVPWDPKKEEREQESYLKFLELMKKIAEEKTKFAKESEQDGPVLKKINKTNK